MADCTDEPSARRYTEEKRFKKKLSLPIVKQLKKNSKIAITSFVLNVEMHMQLWEIMFQKLSS